MVLAAPWPVQDRSALDASGYPQVLKGMRFAEVMTQVRTWAYAPQVLLLLRSDGFRERNLRRCGFATFRVGISVRKPLELAVSGDFA